MMMGKEGKRGDVYIRVWMWVWGRVIDGVFGVIRDKGLRLSGIGTAGLIYRAGAGRLSRLVWVLVMNMMMTF